jgi:hypothetical protein
MLSFARLLESKSCNLTKVAQNQFSKKLSEKQLSKATLSYSSTFIIGLMSTWPADFGRAVAHTRPSKEARVRESLPCS